MRRAGAGIAALIASTSSPVVCSGRRRDDLAGDAAGEALLAVALDDADELGLVVAVHDVGRGEGLRWSPSACRAGRRTSRRSHARPGPAAGCSLPGRTALPRCSPRSRLSAISARCSKPPCTTRARSPKRASALPRRRHRRRIPVDAEEPEVGTGVEQEPGMPTAAGSGVDDRAGRNGREQLHHFPAHDRTMDERRAHRGAPPCRCGVRAPGPPPAPRSDDADPDFSPKSARSKAGGVGAFDRAGRGAGGGPDGRVPPVKVGTPLCRVLALSGSRFVAPGPCVRSVTV